MTLQILEVSTNHSSRYISTSAVADERVAVKSPSLRDFSRESREKNEEKPNRASVSRSVEYLSRMETSESRRRRVGSLGNHARIPRLPRK